MIVDAGSVVHRRRGFRLTLACVTTSATLAIIALASSGGVASADPAAHKPTPRRSVPATPARSAPDMTATIPSRTVPPGGAAEDEPLPPPVQLPKASRARMRACGETWEGMKQSGQAGDDIWRDFATKCLAAKGPPAVTTTQPVTRSDSTKTDMKSDTEPRAARR